MDIQDKVAIVTGASGGIGLATAKLLTQKGARVGLAARSETKLRSLSRKLPHSLPIPTDMTRSSEIKQMIRQAKEHFGRIDILINNAGQGYDAPVDKINIRTFRQIFELDLVGPLIAMQQVIPIMRTQKEGSIVNVSSGTALMTLPNMGPYASLKGALASLSLTAREELQADGIRVSVVYPYITLTDFEKNTLKAVEEEPWEDDGDGTFFPSDTAEFVAEKILEGIQGGAAEIFAHDWMKKSG
jgi:short-subunit dehydrogenase